MRTYISCIKVAKKAGHVRKTIKEIVVDYKQAGLGHGRRTATLTSDSWTSEGHESFTAVTLHFIDDEWELHSYDSPPRPLPLPLPPHPYTLYPSWLVSSFIAY